MNPQELVVDKLNDIPHVTETEVFNELLLVNNKAIFQLSPYVLADLWNKSDAVQIGIVNGRTAADFMVSPVTSVNK